MLTERSCRVHACYNGHCAPVAQLDRASGYEPEGRMFESCRAHHQINTLDVRRRALGESC